MLQGRKSESRSACTKQSLTPCLCHQQHRASNQEKGVRVGRWIMNANAVLTLLAHPSLKNILRTYVGGGYTCVKQTLTWQQQHQPGLVVWWILHSTKASNSSRRRRLVSRNVKVSKFCCCCCLHVLSPLPISRSIKLLTHDCSSCC